MKLAPELRVGIFVAVLLGVLLWGTLKLTGQRGFLGGGYRVSLVLESAEGLRAGGFVRMAGVPIGQVDSIKLEEGRARVFMLVSENVELTENCQVTAKTTGILGDRFLDIRGCTSAAAKIEDGGEIKQVGLSTSLDEITAKLSAIADNIKAVTDALSSVLGGQKGEEEFGAIVRDLRGTVNAVRGIVEENRSNLGVSLANFRKMSESLGGSVPEIAEKLRVAASNIEEFIRANRGRLEENLDKFDAMVAELGESARSLKNISGKIDRGEGTLGKLVNDPTLANSLTKTMGDVQGAIDRIGQLQIGVEYRGEVLAEADGKMKNYVSVRAQPRPDKYYRFGVVLDPLSLDISRGTRFLTGTDGSPGTVESASPTASKDDLKFSVEIAKRIRDVAFRGGLLESTAGVGTDLYLLRDAVMVTAEAFDLAREAGPHFKLRAEYTFLKYVTVNAGWDDPLYKADESLFEDQFYLAEFGTRRSSSLFFGGGLRFTDEDLKTLLPFIPGG